MLVSHGRTTGSYSRPSKSAKTIEVPTALVWHINAFYFRCKTKLTDTLKELYGDKLKFDGNRALVFRQNDETPIDEVEHRIFSSLTYHRRKHLPMLGV